MLYAIIQRPRRAAIWLTLAVASLFAVASHRAAADRAAVNRSAGTANRSAATANRSAATANRGAANNVNATRTSVHNQNVNVNRNVNVNVHGGYHGGYHYDSWGHPIATAAAITATAVAVGTMVAALPTGCTAAGAYQRCGSTYYQPVQQGSTVQYVVVNPP